MGYLASALQSGVAYAEKYEAPKLLEKVRGSSSAVDLAATKLDALLKEQGAPLLVKIDSQLDCRVAQVTALKENVRQKRTEAVEYTQEKMKIVTDPVTEKTMMIRQRAQKKTEETKALLVAKAESAVKKSQAGLAAAQTKAVASKSYAEKKLLTGAQLVDAKLGKSYAEQAASLLVRSVDASLDKVSQYASAGVAAVPALEARVAKAKLLVTGAPQRAAALFVLLKVQLIALPATLTAQKDSKVAMAKAKFAEAKTLAIAKAEKVGLTSKVAAAKAFALEKVKKMDLDSKVAMAKGKVAAAKAFALEKAEKLDLDSKMVMVKSKVAAAKALALEKAEKMELTSKVAAAKAFALEKAEKVGLTSKMTLVMEKAAPYYVQAKDAAQLALAKVRGSPVYEDALEEEDDDGVRDDLEEVSAPEAADEDAESAKSLELD